MIVDLALARRLTFELDRLCSLPVGKLLAVSRATASGPPRVHIAFMRQAVFTHTVSFWTGEKTTCSQTRMIDELTNEPRPHPRTPDPYVDIFGSYDEYMDHVGIGPECWY